MMTELEKKQLKLAIEVYKSRLPAIYLKEWYYWCGMRDVVVSKIGLSEDEVLCLSARYIILLAIESIKRGSGYYKLGHEEFVKMEGSDQILEGIARLQSKADELREKCSIVVEKFENEILKLHNQSR